MMLTVQGHPAYCYTGGKAFDPGLPCAVFIHGAQNDHSVWALQTRYFAHHGFAVLAVDLPGHGRSAGAALETVEAQAHWLLALLDAAGVSGGATLIGHSMGSLIALQAAALAPQRCVAMAMVGTAYPMRVSEALLAAARGPEQEAIEMVTLWSHSSLAPKPSSPGPGFSVIGGSRRLMQKVARASNADGTPARVFLTDFLACNAYAGGEAAAANITCATLLLLGAADQMTPPRATATLRAALPHATVVQVAAAGHALMAEQPDAVLDALFKFASAARAASATST